jgi:uncharacterized OB-fold protein
MSGTLADLAAPFFAACEEHRLVMPRCDACGELFFYPTVLCPYCHHSGHSWVDVTGDATLYTFTEIFRPLAEGMRTPYTVAVVELAEGVRMMSNVVDCPSENLQIGMRLRVDFRRNWEGRLLPMFIPAAL